MSQTKLGEAVVHTCGPVPQPGDAAPAFTLVDIHLKERSLSDYAGKNVILNIFPSIDTSVCATSVREFNKRAANLAGTVVLCISKDLPFAQKRFCGAEGISNVITLSEFRDRSFSDRYGAEMVDGAMRGLHARIVVVIDGNQQVIYSEVVPAIGQEPDYEAALKSLAL
ncbi:MAG: thiol peroxidase [Bacteroidia bacterium]|nr:thiol peroxidase [Bacteroidia bacterium]